MSIYLVGCKIFSNFAPDLGFFGSISYLLINIKSNFINLKNIY